MAKAAVSKMRQVRVGEKEGRLIGEGRWITACKEEMFELIRRHQNVYYQGGKKVFTGFSGIPNSNEGIMSLVLTIFG